MASQLKALAAQQQSMMTGQSPPTAIHAAEPPMVAGVAAKLPAVSSGFGQPSPKAVSKAAQLVGPPPKAKAPMMNGPVDVPLDTGETLEDHQGSAEDATGVARAILQQSAALNSLVAHLTSSDPISDLSSAASSGTSLSTKGAARREKMQAELSAGASQFFMQLQQQLFRRMHPTRVVPKTEEDLVGSGVTMTSYLERYGGYRNKPENAMVMWMLAHIADASAQGDHHKAREYLALTIAAVEQAAMDGNWNIAYLIGLLEEPPAQVYADRQASVTALGRPFAPLIPAAWSAMALAYIKEMDVLDRISHPKSNDPESRTSRTSFSQEETEVSETSKGRGAACSLRLNVEKAQRAVPRDLACDPLPQINVNKDPEMQPNPCVPWSHDQTSQSPSKARCTDCPSIRR